MSDQVEKVRPNPWPIVVGGLLVAVAGVTVLMGEANLRTAFFGLLGLGLLVAGLIRNR